MKLWLLTQTANEGYDTFDSAVMAAETEDEARNMSPGHDEHEEFSDEGKFYKNSWVSNIDDVSVEYIGEAKPGTKKGQIIASFNAG